MPLFYIKLSNYSTQNQCLKEQHAVFYQTQQLVLVLKGTACRFFYQTQQLVQDLLEQQQLLLVLKGTACRLYQTQQLVLLLKGTACRFFYQTQQLVQCLNKRHDVFIKLLVLLKEKHDVFIKLRNKNQCLKEKYHNLLTLSTPPYFWTFFHMLQEKIK